jgi:hypothetical protein
MNLGRLFQAGLGITLIGIVWSVWPHTAGAYYSPQRFTSATYRRGPSVLIDRGHWNESAADPQFNALARVLSSDGYRVTSSRQEIVPELLQTASLLVISDAIGFGGWLQRFGLHTKADAFGADEVEAVRDWVHAGGSLLLIADRPPAVQAARPLAAALGVTLDHWKFLEYGRGRVGVLTRQLADIHDHSVDSRATLLQAMHWLSRAP